MKTLQKNMETINKKILFAILIIINLNFILASCGEGQVDINSASAVELDKIKWVGPATAQKIINSRPFSSLDDLLNVYGIGEIKLQDIKDEGIACVTGSGSNTAEEPEENNTDSDSDTNNTSTVNNDKENDTEPLVYQQVQDTLKETELETINLNPKSINTDENIQKITKRDYVLFGLVIFLIAIILLLLLKKRKTKNEFR